jgi:hypothetical protein
LSFFELLAKAWSKAMSTDKSIRFNLRLTNRLKSHRTVVLEPWTGEYRLGAGESLDIVVEGSPRTPVEIELDEDRIIVYAFGTVGSMLTAFRDGKELRSEHEAPAS